MPMLDLSRRPGFVHVVHDTLHVAGFDVTTSALHVLLLADVELRLQDEEAQVPQVQILQL